MAEDKKIENQIENEVVELADDDLEVVAGGAGKLAKYAPKQDTSDYKAPKG